MNSHLQGISERLLLHAHQIELKAFGDAAGKFLDYPVIAIDRSAHAALGDAVLGAAHQQQIAAGRATISYLEYDWTLNNFKP